MTSKPPWTAPPFVERPRDPRLPPAGTILKTLTGHHVEFTEGKSVIANGETFSSVSVAGTTITGSCMNGYRWAQLGPRGHEWNGDQMEHPPYDPPEDLDEVAPA